MRVERNVHVSFPTLQSPVRELQTLFFEIQPSVSNCEEQFIARIKDFLFFKRKYITSNPISVLEWFSFLHFTLYDYDLMIVFHSHNPGVHKILYSAFLGELCIPKVFHVVTCQYLKAILLIFFCSTFYLLNLLLLDL
jgi:hypothetical protein